MTRLRILATNDLLGAIDPLPASWGRMPGWEALRSAVRAARDGPTIWIDAGDLAQGGPLAPLSDGRLGFAAAGALGIDAAAAGNHELDWGPARLAEEAGRLPFPLLCADAPLGLPASHVLETAAGPVGVIGLTHPDVRAAFEGAPDPAAVAERVRGIAGELRRGGAVAVVAAVHDGVDWRRSTGAPLARPAAFAARIAGWAGAVDAIVAGHTLARWMGQVEGTPVLQPWPMGAELGILDLDPGRRRGSRPAVVRHGGERLAPGPSWRGPGHAEAAAAAAEVVARLDHPLAWGPGRDRSLPLAIGAAMRDAVGADIGILNAGSCALVQAPVDGVLAWLGAGPVTREQLLRVVPWTDPVVVGTVPREELDAIRRRPHAVMWEELVIAGRRGGPRTPTIRVATSAYAASILEALLGGPAGWEPLDLTVRAAFETWLAERS